MSKDDIFKAPRPLIANFDFGEETARVFDDMLDRSVPFYAEIQRMMGEIALDFAVPGTRLYDLGCSTGTTLLLLDRLLPQDVTFVGVDASPEMLDRARAKLAEHGGTRSCELILQNLDHGVAIVDASVVVMNLTLQFVRPLYRDQLIQSIASGTNEAVAYCWWKKYWARIPRSTGCSSSITTTLKSATAIRNWKSPKSGKPWKTS